MAGADVRREWGIAPFAHHPNPCVTWIQCPRLLLRPELERARKPAILLSVALGIKDHLAVRAVARPRVARPAVAIQLVIHGERLTTCRAKLLRLVYLAARLGLATALERAVDSAELGHPKHFLADGAWPHGCRGLATLATFALAALLSCHHPAMN
jgi:hypothetical protein